MKNEDKKWPKQKQSEKLNTSKCWNRTVASFPRILPTSKSVIPRFSSYGFLSYFTLLSLSYFTFLPVHSPQSCSLLLPPPSLSLSLSLPFHHSSSQTPLFRFLPFFTDKWREEGEGEGNLHRKESETRVLQVKKRASQWETDYSREPHWAGFSTRWEKQKY